ncbi:hypothetical protein GCM10009747_23480 [Agromyces humatus]|uniref:Uncharacterized protein n=2 Tax=Agromyces humatus TaxID=279573 RepID=A0ABP4WY49_9MICO
MQPSRFWHAVLMDTLAAPIPDPNSLDLLWGAGLIGIIIGLVIYLAVLALMLWIGYLIIKAAVRNGLREHTLWLESRRGPLR